MSLCSATCGRKMAVEGRGQAQGTSARRQAHGTEGRHDLIDGGAFSLCTTPRAYRAEGHAPAAMPQYARDPLLVAASVIQPGPCSTAPSVARSTSDAVGRFFNVESAKVGPTTWLPNSVSESPRQTIAGRCV
eukprot:scaffold3964_cov126-Isochrysis_galbana.AAC.6